MDGIRGILFDNDGTLVDTYDLILASFRHAVGQVLGCELPEEVLMHKVGQPLAEQVRDFSDDPAAQAELLRVYREYNHAHHDQGAPAFPDVLDGLDRLQRAGFLLGVVTSKMHWLAWRGLTIAGATPYLQCCIGADDCPKFKPDPDPLVMGAHALGLQPEQCLYVGDSPFDIAAGNAAGCQTVAALWGMFPREVLAAENPTYFCNTFTDFVNMMLSEHKS